MRRVQAFGAALFLVLSVVPPAVASLASARSTATVSTCTTGQLSLVYVNATGAAGSVAGQYGFRNRSTHRCRLIGYPTLQMLAATGRTLRTIERHAAPGAFGITPKAVTLRHMAVGYFAVAYASATGYGKLSCPVSAALKVTPPGGRTALVLHGKGASIRPYGGTTVHLRCGIVTVSAVTARRFQ